LATNKKTVTDYKNINSFLQCANGYTSVPEELIELSNEKLKSVIGDAVLTSDTIITHPSPHLRTICERVEPDTDVTDIIAAMVTATKGLKDVSGIAASQVGIPKRVVGIVNTNINDWEYFINPIIVAADFPSTEVEGCLSLPGVSGHVQRSIWVEFEAYTPEWKPVFRQTVHYSQALQHEIDHLNGILFIDRCRREKIYHRNKDDKM